MFPRENRLPSYEIPLLFQSGRTASVEGLQLRYRIRTEQAKRFAVVVPLSLSKKAVVRNRIKRLVREAVRATVLTLPAGIDAVVLVKRNMGWTGIEEMRESMKKLVSRI
jgi:ribonuclease P protein component